MIFVVLKNGKERMTTVERSGHMISEEATDDHSVISVLANTHSAAKVYSDCEWVFGDMSETDRVYRLRSSQVW